MDQVQKDAMAAGRAKKRAQKAALETQVEALQRQMQQLLSDREHPVEPSNTRHDPKPLVMVPYKGFVRAKEPCYIDGKYYVGPDPANRIRASVFEVSMPCLWSDDPFEAVIVTGYVDEEKTVPITAPNPDAPTPIDSRLRIIPREATNPAARAV